MTDKLPPLVTPIVPPSQPLFSLPVGVPFRDVTNRQEMVEEEPYTIKCICNFSDDDGNTIYCETCDTWQHIECYYPNNIEDALREDFTHSCAECNPRLLDRQQAIERQLARTTVAPLEEESPDKKTKRPPSKNHKKKPRPAELQLNGHHHGAADLPKHTNPPEHPPLKRSKNSHKSSHSVSSQAPKHSPPYGIAKVSHGHPPSPATTPPDLPDDVEIHNYSSGFVSLHNNEGITTTHINSFVGLPVSNAMLDWLRDPGKMKLETGCEYDDVFQKLPPNIDSAKRSLEVYQVKKILPGNTVLQWQCLRAPTAIAKSTPLMELNGQIGFQKYYCVDRENRWEEFSSPLPFVLFHPELPLYIDMRKEGSEARYVRRSCRPNAVLETYLSEGREYHFWLVSERQIAAKEQITIAWDFRLPKKEGPRMLRILGLSDEEPNPQTEPCDEMEYQRIANWVHLVLSEYGGCACNSGNECVFAKFHRNYYAKLHARQNPSSKKKARKPKTHTISPTSTGHATNSRAASESHVDEAPEHDARSASESRSKPSSRDLTPTARQGSFDTLGILTEPTDRDKRKVAMVEDSFRRMEQQQQPPRKKKRTSDGTGTSKTRPVHRNSAAQTLLVNGTAERHYVDAATSRRLSGSPASAASPLEETVPKGPDFERQPSVPSASRRVSVVPHPNYCDAGVQTDPELQSWYAGSCPTPSPRKRLVSLSKRLLNNRHRVRLDEERRKCQSVEREDAVDAMNIDSPAEEKAQVSPPTLREAEKRMMSMSPKSTSTGDIPMPDATVESPTTIPSAAENASTQRSMFSQVQIPKHRSPDLRVQMPPVPTFGVSGSAVSSAATPLSAGGSLVQSPFSASPFSATGLQSGFPSPFAPPLVNGVAVNPSPVKKKLSLSDYTKSRMNKTRPPLGTTTLKSMAGSEEPKSATSSVDAGGAADSPTVEKAVDPTLAVNAGVSTGPV